MSEFTDLKKDLLDMMKRAGDNDTSAYDTQATVVRTEGDIIWVHIPGGVAETPIRKTINAKVGDEIQVRVSGGRAWAVGNATSPPTDDTTAIHATQKAETAQETADGAAEAAETAWNWADDAHEAAQTAWDHADDAATAASAAQTSAGQAQASATQANASANNALTQLSTIEDVFNVLNWIADHGTYALTADTEVVPGKYYFTRSGTSPNYSYTVVTNPTGNPQTNGYYELTGVDEAVTNYISSHLALTDQGLWVIKDNQGYKVLLANDGLKIYDNQGHLVSTFGESIVFDSSRPQTIGNNSTYIKWYDSNNDQIPDSIEISGSNVSIADSVTIGGMPTKVSDLTNDSGYQTSSQVSSAISSATSGLATKGNAIKATVSVYYRKTTTGAPSKPTASTTIGTSASTDNAWEYVMPQPKKGCYFYTCERYTFADDNVSFSAVRSIDNATYTSKWCNETDNTYIDGGAIYANSVTADKIAAHSIGATQIAISDNTNLATANELYEDSLPTDIASNWQSTISDGYLVKKATTQQYLMVTGYQPNNFNTGDELYFEFYAKAASATPIYITAWGYKADKSTNGSNSFATAINLTTTETKYTGEIILANAGWDTSRYYVLGFNEPSKSVQIYVRKVIIRRKNGGELIVEGSITVGKLSDDVYVGGRNLLMDTNAPSLTKVAANANRYWSSNSTLADEGTATIVAISDPPAPGIKHGAEYNCTTAGTVSHGLAFYNTASECLTIEAGKTYTQSVYARVVSGTTSVCYMSIANQGTAGIPTFTFTPTTEWKRYVKTFTATATIANKVVYFECGYRAVGKIQMCGFKLEEGSFATGWTPAPEDVDADISDATKTATNYLTTISGVNGITVHNASDTNNFAAFNSNGMQVYKGGNTDAYKVATIGDTITLGTVASDKYNTLIDSTGMKVRKNTTVLASFGTTMIIGDHSGGNILDGTRFQVTDTGAYVQRWLDEAEDYQTLWSATYYNTGSMYPGADMSIGGAYIRGTSDIEGATLEIKATKQISLGLGSADISPLIYINGRQYGANYDLWSGGLYMSAGHTTGDHFNNNLTITDQPHGVVLAWSAYASGAKDCDWVYYFIPKRHVQLYNGTGVGIPLCTQTTSGTITWACKYVYVYNDKITGYGGNNQGNNAKWVLRRVIGV